MSISEHFDFKQIEIENKILKHLKYYGSETFIFKTLPYQNGSSKLCFVFFIVFSEQILIENSRKYFLCFLCKTIANARTNILGGSRNFFVKKICLKGEQKPEEVYKLYIPIGSKNELLNKLKVM